MTPPLAHPLLEGAGVVHGFGVRDASGPEPIVRPRQVHGADVARVDAAGVAAGADLGEADAVVSRAPGVAVGVATADCVPVLVASADGAAVAAIHAGWRGLACGVIPAGVAALRELARPGSVLVAAIGPHIGACCYEVDAPVLGPLAERFGAALEPALRPARSGHAYLDLGELARAALVAAGVEAARVGALADACTACDALRFHSYRRDGPRSGRLIHFVAARRGEA